LIALISNAHPVLRPSKFRSRNLSGFDTRLGKAL